MKNIWKIVIFVSVLITVVLIRECTLIPDYSSSLIPYTSKISKKNYIDWDILHSTELLTDGKSLFDGMQKYATEKDIQLMTNSLQPVMRVYAACLAKENDKVHHYEILCDHLNDIAEVEVRFLQSAYRKKVGDFYMLFLYDHLSPSQKQQVDSIILFDKTNKLDARTTVMERLSPDPRYYTRIRELYSKEYQKNALVFLARFRNQQDVDFIQHELTRFYNPNMNEALAAVCEYPAPLFLPSLFDLYTLFLDEKLSSAVDSELLFRALMSYESIKVYALLKNTIRNADSVFIRNNEVKFLRALSQMNSTFYSPLGKMIIQRKALLGL